VGPLQQVGQQPRLADPRLAVDHHQPTRVLLERPQALGKCGAFINTAEHRPWTVGLAGRLYRPIHLDRRGLALDRNRREVLEPQARSGRPMGRRIAEDGVWCGLHQPGRQVHHLTDDVVLAMHLAADGAAERPPGGKPNRAPHAQLPQGRRHRKRGPGRPGRVVLMGQGGSPNTAISVRPLSSTTTCLRLPS
jgi:hypothetical protein